MLKTNSKKARENIRAFILKHADFEGRDMTVNAENISEVSRGIYEIFCSEKSYSDGYMYRRGISEQAVFDDWCRGLPSALGCEPFLLGSAVYILGNILEETEEERSRYTEEQAEKLMIYLLYREIVKAKEV